MEAYFGYIETVQDALVVVEAARSGLLPRIVHRLTEAERRSVRSGSVYVWDEAETSMRRWTDGRAWSPSRVSGCFLNYREYEDRSRATSLSGASGGWSTAISWVPVDSDDIKSNAYVLRHTGRARHGGRTSPGSGGGRSRPHLVYKPGGLIKRTISVTVSDNRKLHLISYFVKRDVMEGRLRCPRHDPALTSLTIPGELYPDLIVANQDGEERASASPEPSSPLAQWRPHLTTPDLNSTVANSAAESEQLHPAHTPHDASQLVPIDTCRHRRVSHHRVGMPAPTPAHQSICAVQHCSPDASPEPAYTMLYQPSSWQPLPRSYPPPPPPLLLPPHLQAQPPPHCFVPTPSVSPDPTLFRASCLNLVACTSSRKQVALTDQLHSHQDAPAATTPLSCPATPPFPLAFNDRRLPPLSIPVQCLPQAQHLLMPNPCGEDRRQLDALQSHLLL